MKKFFKLNKVLCVAFCIGMLAVCIILFFIVQAYSQRDNAIYQLDGLKDQIKRLNSYKPYPSERNAELITSDINTLKTRTFQLENVFGNIYDKPLLMFTETLRKNEINELEKKIDETKTNKDSQQILNKLTSKLNTITSQSDIEFEMAFLASWKSYVDKQNKSKNKVSLEDLLNGFIDTKEYSPDGFPEAKKMFLKEMKKQTLEPLDEEIINDYILNALGVPLFFSRIKSKNLVFTVQSKINELLKQNKITIIGNEIAFFGEITTVPTDEQIPYIINYCRFLEDFYSRLAKVRINTLESYKKVNGLTGSENNDFLVFSYQITLIASQNSLRDFLNSLQEAYKDNRMYIVKNLTLTAIEDITQNLPPNIPTKTDLKENEIKIIPSGNTDNIRATITVDYVIYKKKILD